MVEILDYSRKAIPNPLVNWRRVGLIVVVATVALLIYRPFSPGGRQARNLAKAQAHIPIIQAKIANDHRFDHIECDDFTGGGGCLLLYGEIRSDEDLRALKNIVMSTSPPVGVVYRVDIYSEKELLKLDAAKISTSRPTTSEWHY